MCLTTKLSTEDTEDEVGVDCLYSSRGLPLFVGWIALIRRVNCLDLLNGLTRFSG